MRCIYLKAEERKINHPFPFNAFIHFLLAMSDPVTLTDITSVFDARTVDGRTLHEQWWQLKMSNGVELTYYSDDPPNELIASLQRPGPLVLFAWCPFQPEDRDMGYELTRERIRISDSKTRLSVTVPSSSRVVEQMLEHAQAKVAAAELERAEREKHKRLEEEERARKRHEAEQALDTLQELASQPRVTPSASHMEAHQKRNSEILTAIGKIRESLKK